LQVSQRNLALLRGVELLEEFIEVEGDVVGLLLLLLVIIFLPRWRLRRWGWWWRRRRRWRRMCTGSGATP
jgi:hypothetical protein